MSFETLIMQIANQTTGTFANTSTDFIMQAAALMSVIGPLVVFFANRFLTGRVREIAVEGGQIATGALQKATEAKDRIRVGLDALYELTPDEQKKVLDERMPSLSKLAEEVKVGTAQVERINSVIQPEFNPKTLEIPREKFNTKPEGI